MSRLDSRGANAKNSTNWDETDYSNGSASSAGKLEAVRNEPICEPTGIYSTYTSAVQYNPPEEQ
jgi:hypothetical protein